MQKNKKIKLKSRGYENNYLVLLEKPNSSESKTYILRTESSMVRVGYTNEEAKFIDPSGGPMIVEGSILPEIGMKVKNIDFITGHGYAITFE